MNEFLALFTDFLLFLTFSSFTNNFFCDTLTNAYQRSYSSSQLHLPCLLPKTAVMITENAVKFAWHYLLLINANSIFSIFLCMFIFLKVCPLKPCRLWIAMWVSGLLSYHFSHLILNLDVFSIILSYDTMSGFITRLLNICYQVFHFIH